MRYPALLALLLSPLLNQPTHAQQGTGPKPVQPVRPLELPALQPPIADTGIFSPIPLPPANEVRLANGAPGPRYWQQRVDYSIKATLDTSSQRLTGTESIRYTNNSPDSLRFLWMQLDQNLFRPGSTGSLLFASESRFGGAGFKGGFDITSISQCSATNEAAATAAAKRKARARTKPRETDSSALTSCPPTPLRTRVDDTMMYVELAKALAPGGTTALQLSYSFNIPEHGADRMGRDGSLYEIAQWYPRMAVYDDVHGWNTDQYLGQGEFYLEYGDIDYEVTVPAGYIVAGSGVLQNPGEVLTEAQRARLATAVKSDTTIHIITSQELTSGAARPAGAQGLMTWRFRAENVRDAAWSASPDYLWDASGWGGILAQAYFRPSAVETWKDAAKMSRYSILEYSTRWFGYPYPQISAVEGPVSGMEYPMLVMEARNNTSAKLYNVITHEIGHNWYPMVVGSDERRYAWMDEGFNTFVNTFSEEGYWKRDDSAIRQGERELVNKIDQAPTAQPIMTPANRYRTSNNLLSLAYVKPSIELLTLRNKVLGAEVFDSAFREYTRRWAFKHPQPADFFRTIDEVSGRDLSWFWRGFFYTTAALDQSVESVKQEPDGSGQVTLANLGDAVMPVELQLGYDDGTNDLVKLPVEIWYGGNRYAYATKPGKTIVSAQVNPDGTFPDAIPTNDVWRRPTASATP
jgi:Peptidase family M1 domain